MLAVIFELEPQCSKTQGYFQLAADLKHQLQGIDGFISIERFQSLGQENKYLSLSFWRDEQAIAAWRNAERHRQAQEQGRDNILAYYRLRVAQVVRDYDIHASGQRPKDSCQRFLSG